MKLITYTYNDQTRLGAVRGTQVIDLAAASDGKLPGNMLAFLQQGEPAMALARQLLDSAAPACSSARFSSKTQPIIRPLL